MQVERIDPDLILVGERLRPLNPEKVSELADSFAKFGQQTPITVWAQTPERIHLIAGNHRLAAAKSLGLAEIDCVVVDMDATDRRLWEIAENLHRCELTVQERADHIAEWVSLTAEREGAQLAPPGGRQPHSKGIKAAVSELGIDRTQAQRAVKIASITPEAKVAARDAGIDNNQSALLKVAAVAPEQQAEYVRQYVSPDRIAKKQDSKELREQAAEEFAGWLSEKGSYDEHPMIIAWLEAVNAKPVIDAFRRLNGAVFDSTKAGS